MLEAGESIYSIPMKIELPFDRNIVYNWGLSNMRHITFVQNSTIQVDGKSTVCLVRKPSKVLVGVSCRLFPYENGRTIWKEYCQPLRVFKREKHHLLENSSVQVNGRSTIFLVRYPSMLETGGLAHCLFYRIEFINEMNTRKLSGF
jgi:hypothetical protein